MFILTCLDYSCCLNVDRNQITLGLKFRTGVKSLIQNFRDLSFPAVNFLDFAYLALGVSCIPNPLWSRLKTFQIVSQIANMLSFFSFGYVLSIPQHLLEQKFGAQYLRYFSTSTRFSYLQNIWPNQHSRSQYSKGKLCNVLNDLTWQVAGNDRNYFANYNFCSYLLVWIIVVA